MKITFWGVRGSIPCPGPKTVKYGGNTPCIELRFNGLDRLVIIDAGTGIRELGNHLMAHKAPDQVINAEIFLTHTHWDHIQGFPFFAPIYLRETVLKVYGPVTFEGETLEKVVGGQWVYRYFPVAHWELASQVQYIDLPEGIFDLGEGIKLITKYMNHPLLCLGYRFEFDGKILCTAYDTEPFRNLFLRNPGDPSYDETMAREAEQAAREANAALENFFSGADLLIYDAPYTQEEYESAKVGWGHSSMEHAISSARRAAVKRLALFHHEPTRTDAQMDALAEKLDSTDSTGDTLEVFFAREGQCIEI